VSTGNTGESGTSAHPGNVSIDEVAKAAGVSTATVSRALRGLPSVKPATTAAVLAAAAQLGYVPSPSASALASGRTRTVGLVAPAISRWFFATTLEGAEHALRAANYDALLYSLPDTQLPRKTFEAEVLARRVDAVVVASMFFSQDEVAQLRQLNVPAIFISVRQPDFPHVGIDDEAAATTAVQHLFDLGHRVIGHVSGSAEDRNPAAPTMRRRNGWRAALRTHGLSAAQDLDAPADMTAEGGYQATNALLDRRPDVTAVFAASDETAMGAIHALRRRGLEPGRDISVIGLDGHNLGQVLGLTTVSQPAYQQGFEAARLLLAAADGAPLPEQTVFPTELVARTSTGPAPTA
jgi:DNA-binding LacI/PurR family transcriptional regulator